MLLQKESSGVLVNIKAYEKGKITTNVGIFEKVISLSEGKLVDFEGAASFIELTFEDLLSHLDDEPEVLIIGSGEAHRILPIRIVGKLNEMGIAVESMASRQACHTYQVLCHDQRKVRAIIYP